MLHSTVFFALTIVAADDSSKKTELPIQPVPNQRELIEKIVAIGGDAEHVGGFIILVSLRDATDEDFKLLKDLKAVRFLDCAYCKTDGSGLANIAQMKRLEKLWLHDNTFKVKHLRYISDFPRLNFLYLENTPTTNCGLRHIRNLKSLERLYLANTKVTDNGLRHLYELKNLKTLDLNGTKVTTKGIEDLKKHLPKTSIWAP